MGGPRVWLQEGECERELKDESLVDGDGQVPPEATTQPGCNIPSARVGGGAGRLCLIIWRISAFTQQRKLTTA